MLTKNFGRALQLSTNYSADQMILELARQMDAARQPLFRSVHLFPFGSFERTAAWARSLAGGKI
jgi:methylenetetrahydrofolate reductase (NADPH)